MEKLNSVVVYCDPDLDIKTIKIPKDIDIEKCRFIIARPSFSSKRMINLKDYTIVRIDDYCILASVDVYKELNLDFGGDLVYIL